MKEHSFNFEIPSSHQAVTKMNVRLGSASLQCTGSLVPLHAAAVAFKHQTTLAFCRFSEGSNYNFETN
jgi:hypothetical protein